MKYGSGEKRGEFARQARRINRIAQRRVSFVRLLLLPLVGLRSRTFPRSIMSDPTIYCAQQINIPPTFPHILKLYAKAAIRTQPHDLLRWTAAYFRALANGKTPPAKVRFSFLREKYVVPRQFSTPRFPFSIGATFPQIHYSSRRAQSRIRTENLALKSLRAWLTRYFMYFMVHEKLYYCRKRIGVLHIFV